jgi:hypothetical protein
MNLPTYTYVSYIQIDYSEVDEKTFYSTTNYQQLLKHLILSHDGTHDDYIRTVYTIVRMDCFGKYNNTKYLQVKNGECLSDGRPDME